MSRGGQVKRAGAAARVVQIIILLAIIPAVAFVIYISGIRGSEPAAEVASPIEIPAEPVFSTAENTETPSRGVPYEPEPEQEPEPLPEPEPEPEPVQKPPSLPEFAPYPVESTMPDRLLSSTAIMADGQITDSYIFPEPMDFDLGENYTALEGVLTFRGNNFRDSPTYGGNNLRTPGFGDTWTAKTGSLVAPDGNYWSGHGWTGQPLIVKWPIETRRIMNMHQWAKEQEELVEVIYPSQDGCIYFLELTTGKQTRNKYNLGYTIKGTASIDPRGYPLLYTGAGYGSAKGSSRMFVISLIDGSVLYQFGHGDSFAKRTWSAADSSPIVDIETDRLIFPSENGVIYFVKLNSNYDPEAGTMTIEPTDVVKWRYISKRSQTGQFWLGIEASVITWRGYLFAADNGGHLICLDLNTLETVWVQDVLDDTNCTPVLELEDGHPYLYISTSFHAGWRAGVNSSATIPIWKIDAVTGEIVWRTEYKCYTADGNSGGVQGSPALGKNELSELVYFPVARTPRIGAGILTAINKHTGEVVWEYETSTYSWSSPVCVYDGNGKGYVLHLVSGGYMYLLDGLTGERLDTIELGPIVEASPAVYDNTIVVGTRSMKIWGVTLNKSS